MKAEFNALPAGKKQHRHSSFSRNCSRRSLLEKDLQLLSILMETLQSTSTNNY